MVPWKRREVSLNRFKRDQDTAQATVLLHGWSHHPISFFFNILNGILRAFLKNILNDGLKNKYLFFNDGYMHRGNQEKAEEYRG